MPVDVRVVDNRDLVAAYLMGNPDLHVYSLGDLEDAAWPHSTFYGGLERGVIKALCLVFTGYDPPSVHTISEAENSAMPELLKSIANLLPDSAQIHLGPASGAVLSESFDLIEMKDHLKMALGNRAGPASVETSGVQRLGRRDVDRLLALYDRVAEESGHRGVFNPAMLDIGPYFGVKEGNQLVAAAGVHVFSPRYRVAAVANVATHPDHWGRGLASAVTGALCQELASSVNHIGLNVARLNLTAIHVYQRLGFQLVGSYKEGRMARKQP